MINGRADRAGLAKAHVILAGPAVHFLTDDVVHELTEAAARLEQALGLPATIAWYAGGKPTLLDELESVAAAGETTIAVVPYLLQWRYPDQFFLPTLIQEFAAAHPAVTIHLAQPIGLSDGIEAILLDRAKAALAGPDAGRLDRAALHEVAHLKATIKHDPKPPRYAGFARHVFICQGGPCAEVGSLTIERELRAEIKAAGLDRGLNRVHITRTQCLGPCAGGPVCVVYPAGDWYHGIERDRIPDLIASLAHGDDAAADKRFRSGAARSAT